ncbi:MAG: hypothetical protein IKJ80_01010 [Clostridia bacterium]|nr:hypothetical protein [Clostridia bacterium]
MKFLRKISALLLLICIMLTAISCGPKLVFEDGKILDTKTDVYYNFAPNTYEAIAIANAIYAVWEQNDVEVAYHAIEGLPTEEYLVDEYGYVICADGKELPELDGFEPAGALVCTNTDVAVSIGEIKEKATLNALVDLYMNGDSQTFKNTAVDTLSIKFTSEKYPHLYFSLSVMIEEDRSVYLWNRDSGRYVNVGSLLDQYVEGYLY